MQKLRLRETGIFAQIHTARKGQGLVSFEVSQSKSWV